MAMLIRIHYTHFPRLYYTVEPSLRGNWCRPTRLQLYWWT